MVWVWTEQQFKIVLLNLRISLDSWQKLQYLQLMWCKPLIFQTQLISSGMDSRVHSLKYLRYRTLDYKYTDQKIRVCDKDSSPLGGELKNTFPGSGYKLENSSRFRLETGDYLQAQVSNHRISPGSGQKLKVISKFRLATKEYLQVQVIIKEYLQDQVSNQRISPGSGYKLQNIFRFTLATEEYLQVQVGNWRISPGSG